MKSVWLGCLLCSRLLLATSPEQEINVNARYTVESVELAGDQPAEISTGLRGELNRLVGEKLDPAALDDLGTRIRHELHVRAVYHRVMRGQNPDHVRVVFDVRGRPAKFEASVPKLLYSSQAGFTGAIEGTATVGSQALTLGTVSDGDALLERYSGIFASYEDKRISTDRVRFRLLFEDYHEQWDHTTTAATSAIYRNRQNIQPVVTVVLTRALSLGVGASFERFQDQFPAARTDSANSMVTTLRYHRRLEGTGATQQEVDAGYSLRAATHLLASGYVYARHQGHVRYGLTWGHSQIHDDVTAGLIAGQAPLFERFVFGNSDFLPGWNKFALDPLGGGRMIHNSVDYQYRVFDVFYDCGTIWDQGEGMVLRNSLGVGLRHNGLRAGMAFPLTGGHIEPVFMVGMNY